MITMEEKKIPLLNTLEKHCEDLDQNSTSAWFKTLRQEALARFLTLGIPTTKNEDYKYTNLSVLSSRHFKPVTKAALPTDHQLSKICSQNDITLVFVNGILDENLSSYHQLPKGLTILPLEKELSDNGSSIKNLLNQHDLTKENRFTSLNRALINSGCYLHIADKVIIEKLIHIIHITQCKESGLTAPSTFIVVDQSAQATVMETHIGTANNAYVAVAATEIFLKNNAILHYCKAQSESLNAYHLGNTRVWQERDSHFDGFALMNGGEVTRNDLDIVSNGEGTSSTLNGFYGLTGKQHVDNHSSMDHRWPNCTSNQLYKGLLNGESHSVFNGKIFVRQIAQKTNSYQLNKNLILGVNCRVDTKPQLEIFADDVKCTHGATIGQLNEDEIFYLQTRGISKKDAVKLLAHGFVQDILEKIHHPAIIQKLNILLEPTFAALEE
ncbi:MAG: Fe-S cluster assembly protein SufD [Candidatus Omnitrophica bacterium]|nr:Fe-S cluster assembly protein SufD [Candidatus Omnitrophota bacterium]